MRRRAHKYHAVTTVVDGVTADELRRFWSKVQKGEQCWNWQSE